MAKEFVPRVSKKNRQVKDISDKLSRDLFQLADQKLLEGAKLQELELKSIVVKDQVRTKFNDSSIKELSDNIRANGLIQPLVVHLEREKYVLICGERRFRAMGLIDDMEKCPCFILEDKSSQELMAIQFSENSSREELHYIDRADGILNYQKATKASERKITKALGISKSEVHRALMIARLPKKIKEAAKEFNTEKYVLLEYDALSTGTLKKSIYEQICIGKIIKRGQIKRILTSGKVVKSNQRTTPRKSAALPSGLSANAFLKAMQSKAKDLDPETAKLLKGLVEDTKGIIRDQ